MKKQDAQRSRFMMALLCTCTLTISLCSIVSAQSPLPSSKQGILLSNTQSGASERWISLFAPRLLSANYRLILPLTAPTANQMLSVSSVSGTDDSLTWVNGVSGSGTSTRIAFWNSTSTLSSSANLFWDNTNGRLGIGTSSPGQKLEIMNGNFLLNNNNNTAAELRFAEPSTSGSNYIAFKSPAVSSSTTYTLPSADGSSDAPLTTNGSGTLSWATTGITRYVLKSADESVANSTTLQDDDNLLFSIGANEVWEVDFMIRVTGVNGRLKFALALPASATMWVTARGDNDDSNDDYLEMLTSGTGYTFSTTNFDYSDTGTMVELRGIVTNSSTAGNVVLRWCQASSNATATIVKAGSYLKVTRVQ